jgi:peptidoglycan/xylan/chitin deacetylase (PgdA/CDA1 family)
MRLKQWFALRGSEYVRERGTFLLDRYDISPAKAADRIKRGMAMLAGHGCFPTFPTPGRIVQQYPKFIRDLQNAGAEIAVHGYDHLDLGALTPAEARAELERAVRVFNRAGIEVHGFRCPYLSCREEQLRSLPVGLFGYSSNKAIRWNVVPSDSVDSATTVFDRIAGFYRAESSDSVIAVPRFLANLVEIPVSTPDDLQLLDGLALGQTGLREAWTAILHQTHSRGECFVVVFHPEAFDQCAMGLDGVLSKASSLLPTVWVTPLAGVSQWWKEKSKFTIEITQLPSGARIRFDCSERATVLVRNLATSAPTHDWEGSYRVLDTRLLNLGDGRLPFIGLGPGVPKNTLSFLREQGYIVDASLEPSSCSIYLDEPTAARLNEVELVDYVESSPAQLVRFWRWPNEAKSALCVTGDLDALSLLDYAARLFSRDIAANSP